MQKDWILKMNRFCHQRKPFLFILDFDLKNVFIEELHNLNPYRILYSLNGKSNQQKKPNTKRDSPIEILAEPPGYEFYFEKFSQVQKEIQAGNTYLLNLTFKHPVRINASLKEIFFLSKAPYKLWMKDHLVVFSPESFIKIVDGKISTFPMKGTAEMKDENSIKDLLENEKESAEHATITDLLRNDLGRVAVNIKVKRYRYIDEIRTENKTILQVSSEISGQLDNNYREKIGDIFNELLPAGSVTGAPKRKTVEIINSTENYNRGFYTGVFGIYDGSTIDSAVIIRCIEKENNYFYYKSGGGITFMSEPEKEYREIIQKIYVPVY